MALPEAQQGQKRIKALLWDGVILGGMSSLPCLQLPHILFLAMLPQSHPTRDASCTAPCCPGLLVSVAPRFLMANTYQPVLFPPRWRKNWLAWDHMPQPGSCFLHEFAAPGHGLWQLSWVRKKSTSICFTSRSNRKHKRQSWKGHQEVFCPVTCSSRTATKSRSLQFFPIQNILSPCLGKQFFLWNPWSDNSRKLCFSALGVFFKSQPDSWHIIPTGFQVYSAYQFPKQAQICSPELETPKS